MGTAGTVGVDFEGNFGQINSQLSSFVSSGIGQFARLEQLSKSSFVRIGAAGAAVAFGLFKVGDAFDSAYDTIRVGTGATGKDLNKLQGDFKAVVADVPADFGSASTAIADINTRLGLTGPTLQKRAKQFLELSRITGTDLAGNIESASRVFGAFEVQTEDQADALDAMFRASQASGIGLDRLAEQGINASATLRTLGFGFTESIAMLAQFEKAGVSGERVLSGLKLGINKLAKDGESVPDTFRRILNEIKNTQDPTERLNRSFELFGTRAGTDLADAIAIGAFSVEEMYEVVANGSDTIMKASKDTQDFGEKWQMVKNRAMLAFEPIAVRTFDIVGKIADAFTSIPDWGQQFLIGGAAVAFALSPMLRFGSAAINLATDGLPRLVSLIGQGGLGGAAARGGLALAGLGLGLGLVKPKMDELGVSSTISGAAIGAMTGLAFGPWGAAVGGVLGGVAGAFGILGDSASDERERVAAEMERIRQIVSSTAAQLAESGGQFTGTLLQDIARQVGLYDELANTMGRVGVTWDEMATLINTKGPGAVQTTADLRAAFGLSVDDANRLLDVTSRWGLALDDASAKAANQGVALGDLGAVQAVAEAAFARSNDTLSRLAGTQSGLNLSLYATHSALGPTIDAARRHAEAVLQQSGSADAANYTMSLYRERMIQALEPVVQNRQRAEELIDELIALGDQKPKPTVDMNTQPFDGKRLVTVTNINDLNARRPTPTIDANKGPFNVKRDNVFGDVTAMGSWSGKPTLDANDAPWGGKKDALRNDLLNISRSSAGPGIGGAGGLFSAFFESGGEVPGRRGEAVPITAHGGEYVLSADIVDRIKRGAPSRGAEPFAAAGGAGGLHIEHAYFGDRHTVDDLDYFVQTRMAGV